MTTNLCDSHKLLHNKHEVQINILDSGKMKLLRPPFAIQHYTTQVNICNFFKYIDHKCMTIVASSKERNILFHFYSLKLPLRFGIEYSGLNWVRTIYFLLDILNESQDSWISQDFKKERESFEITAISLARGRTKWTPNIHRRPMMHVTKSGNRL